MKIIKEKNILSFDYWYEKLIKDTIPFFSKNQKTYYIKDEVIYLNLMHLVANYGYMKIYGGNYYINLIINMMS